MKSSGVNIRQFDYLLVDGYNIIHNWDELSELANTSLELARDRLTSMLANYQGFRGINVIIVFDAHKIRFGRENVVKSGNITLIYTAEAETADSYIERTITALSKNVNKYRTAVATSDSLEQVIIMAKGAYRLSAGDLLTEIKTAETEIRRKITTDKPIKNNQLLDNLDPKMANWLEEMRLKKEL